MQEIYLYLFMILVVFVIIFIILVCYIAITNRQQKANLINIIKEQNKSDYQYISELKNNINHELSQIQINLNRDLLSFHTNMASVLKDDINKLNNNTTKHLMDIENTVNKSIITSFDKTEKMMVSFSERMTKIDETQKDLKDLSLNITSLHSLLNDKKSRGIFGEIELYSILENVFGDNENYFLKQHKLSNGYIADAVILGPKSLGNIVIDSKFPLENYNRMYDINLSKKDKEIARNNFKKDIIKHINDIANKYITASETADVAYMFIPAESVFSEIYSHFDDVINYSYKKHVYIVSPTTLMAYITAIKALYIGQKRDEEVLAIQEEYAKLAIEFKRYIERLSKVYSDFEKCNNDLKDLKITSDKIIKRFNEIDNVKLDVREN